MNPHALTRWLPPVVRKGHFVDPGAVTPFETALQEVA